MYTCLKRIMIIVLCLVLLSPLSADLKVQAASPSVSVSAPDTLQVQIDEAFVIPVTISAIGIEIFLAEVHAVAESGVSVKSQTVSRIVSAGSSTRVIVMGTARTKGFHRVEIQVFAFPRDASPSLPMITTEVMVEVTEAPGQEPRPRFEIRSVSFVPENPDVTKPFTLNVNLRNIGNETARNIEATFEGGDNFAVTTLTNRIHIPSAGAGQEAVASFQIRAKNTHKSNEVTLSLIYGDHTQTERINLPFPEKHDLPKRLPPILKVGSFNMVPTGENNLSLTLNVQNIGEQTAQSVIVSIDGEDELVPLEASGIRRISSLAEGTSVTFQYLLSPKGELANHPLNIKFNFKDPDGENIEGNETIFVSSNLEPSLKITGFSVRP